jgi:hypothetical protein
MIESVLLNAIPSLKSPAPAGSTALRALMGNPHGFLLV